MRLLISLLRWIVAPVWVKRGLSGKRVPTKKQVQNMLLPAKRRNRLAKSSFVGLHLLGERNPDRVYMWVHPRFGYFIPHRSLLIFRNDQHSKTSKLKWAATDKSALLAAVQYSQHRGIAIDSSWRHKNENAAPLTFIVTTNSAQHVRPSRSSSFPCGKHVSSLISPDINSKYLRYYPKTFKRRPSPIICVKRKPKWRNMQPVWQVSVCLPLSLFRYLMRCSLDGVTDDEFNGLDKKDQAKVLASAKQIKTDGWIPIMVMIDKDAAERNAIIEGTLCSLSHSNSTDVLYP